MKNAAKVMGCGSGERSKVTNNRRHATERNFLHLSSMSTTPYLARKSPELGTQTDVRGENAEPAHGRLNSAGCDDKNAVQTTAEETTPLLRKGGVSHKFKQTFQIDDDCCQGDVRRATVNRAGGQTV